jgi:hypothetical protein
MLNTINGLFGSCGFSPKDVDTYKLFSANESDGKISFWLVIQESDLDSLLEKQPTLLSDCKKVCQHPSLEKNLSMLVLWDTKGEIGLSEMKKKVMTVEENPYFFKKYVHYFSPQEFESLNQAMEGMNLYDFLRSQLPSQETFSAYKVNPICHDCWQPLIYRIAMKLPFVGIDIDVSAGLKSLLESIHDRVEAADDHDLVGFDRQLFKKLEPLTVDKIKETDATTLLRTLAKILLTEEEGADVDPD